MSTEEIRLSVHIGSAIVDALKREGKVARYFCLSILNQLLAAASIYTIINEQLKFRYSCFSYIPSISFIVFFVKRHVRLWRNNPIKSWLVVIRFVLSITRSFIITLLPSAYIETKGAWFA
jgi:hypothetical protein